MTKRILVVEDNAGNLEAARKFFESQQGVEVDFASDYKQANQMLQSGNYDGAILDLFMPYDAQSQEKGEEVYKLLKRMNARLVSEFEERAREEREDQTHRIGRALDGMFKLTRKISEQKTIPMGISLAEEARKRKLPAVFATSGHHHDALFEPVFQYLRLELPDTPINEQRDKSKQDGWREAYESLKLQIGDLDKTAGNETTSSLEEKVKGTLAIISLAGGLFFLSSNITGNAIGNMANSTSNIIGAILLVIGVIAGYFWIRK